MPARRVTVGTSIRLRSSVMSSSWRSVTSVTRKPLLRTDSTRPSLVRSSSASRTGVAETPKRPASDGAEYTVPGCISPETTAARSALPTCSRRLWRSTSGSTVIAAAGPRAVIARAPAPRRPARRRRGERGSQDEAGRERVGRVEHVLGGPRHPGPAGDRGDDGRDPRHGGLADEPPGEPRPDERLVDELVAERELTARVELGHPRR